jgi:hypothetical protein
MPMNYDDLRCPKCNGSMTRGFTVDTGGGGGGWGMDHAAKWAPGHPIKSFIMILAPFRSTPVATFRCEACGFLESYAGPEFASKRQFSLRAMLVTFTIVAIAMGLLAALMHAIND